ncbi:MAG: transcription-repair coupling factor (superfamily II helicase), partial [Bacteroidia bacterium]
MDLLELRDRIGSASGVGQTVDALNSDNAKLRWGNVSGSALSMLLSKVLDQHRSDHLIILNDAEEAAYFLSDLEPLLGKRKAMLFPMSYRRPYELEEVDNSNVIQRAELLSRVRSSTSGNVIVTYPKALAEQVVSRRQLGKNTLSISTGETLALETLVEVLFEYHFERVDQVYEPGQFAV